MASVNTSGSAPAFAAVGGERTVGELFGTLASEMATLMRQEVQLATTEMTQKATAAGKQVAILAAGSLLGVVSLLTLIAALVLGLATMMEPWLSALLVGAVIGLVAFALAAKARAALHALQLKPVQTIQSMNENKSWLQEQIR